jgi:hypothetical protein
MLLHRTKMVFVSQSYKTKDNWQCPMVGDSINDTPCNLVVWKTVINSATLFYNTVLSGVLIISQWHWYYQYYIIPQFLLDPFKSFKEGLYHNCYQTLQYWFLLISLSCYFSWKPQFFSLQKAHYIITNTRVYFTQHLEHLARWTLYTAWHDVSILRGTN